MPLLQLNGVEVKCDSADYKPTWLQDIVRAASGRPLLTSSVRKDEYTFRTSELLSVERAAVLRSLIEGEGHVFNFNDISSLTAFLYSSREAYPDSPISVSRTSSFVRWGSASLLPAPGTAVVWTLSTAAIRATAMGWMKRGAEPWRHIIEIDEPAGARCYVNGVESYDFLGYMFPSSVAGSKLVLSAPSGEQVYYNDVVWLPFLLPAEWVPGVYGFHSRRAWPLLPEVYAEGARIPNGLTCLGRCGTGRTQPKLGGIAETFDFTLYGK